MITKKDFLRKVSAETGFTMKDIDTVLEASKQVIVETVKNHDVCKAFDGIWFEGFATEPRTGRNPKSGEPIDIPAKTRCKVKFCKSFKDAIAD